MAYLYCKTAVIKNGTGAYLVVQWLRLHTSTAGAVGSVPGWRTKKTKDTEKDAHAVEGKAVHKTEGMIPVL